MGGESPTSRHVIGALTSLARALSVRPHRAEHGLRHQIVQNTRSFGCCLDAAAHVLRRAAATSSGMPRCRAGALPGWPPCTLNARRTRPPSSRAPPRSGVNEDKRSEKSETGPRDQCLAAERELLLRAFERPSILASWVGRVEVDVLSPHRLEDVERLDRARRSASAATRCRSLKPSRGTSAGRRCVAQVDFGGSGPQRQTLRRQNWSPSSTRVGRRRDRPLGSQSKTQSNPHLPQAYVFFPPLQRSLRSKHQGCGPGARTGRKGCQRAPRGCAGDLITQTGRRLARSGAAPQPGRPPSKRTTIVRMYEG